MSRDNCVNIEENEKNCPCPAVDCQRHGLCCACLQTHTEKDSLTKCLRDRLQQSQPFREHILALIDQA